jgi:hypothetical protein
MIAQHISGMTLIERSHSELSQDNYFANQQKNFLKLHVDPPLSRGITSIECNSHSELSQDNYFANQQKNFLKLHVDPPLSRGITSIYRNSNFDLS